MALFLVTALNATGCLPAATVPSRQGEIALFYIINQTNREIDVRVLADGEQLFTVRLGPTVISSGEVRELPPRGRFPAKEVKAWLSSTPKELTVQELLTGRSQKLRLTGSMLGGLRCKITLTDEGIEITQDYVPIR